MKFVVLMIELEQPEGVSARKLTLETAKYNVLTAYSGHYGLDLFRRFPNIDAAVVYTAMEDVSFERIVSELQAIRPGLPIIAICPSPDGFAGGADYSISSHDPELLLKTIGRFRDRSAKTANSLEDTR